MSVYFVQAGDYIKIGHSEDPIARSATVTRLGIRPSDLPYGADADLIGWIPGDTWRERTLHVEHLATRVAGEWFHLDREYVRDLIWRDPAGVDLHRMTAVAVMACRRSPGLLRDELKAAGVRVIAATPSEIDASLDALLRAS
jgi:hypothetical protein